MSFTSTLAPTKKSKISFWSPEMAHDVIETPDFLWGSRVCDTIVVLIVFLLLIDHVYNVYITKSVEVNDSNTSKSGRVRNRTGSSKSAESRGSAVHPRWFEFRTFLTTAFIFCSFMTALIQCINIWSLLDSELFSCQLIMYIYCVFYHLTKLSLYCIFIVTSYVVFNDSSFKYNAKFILFCLIVVGLFGIFLVACTNYAIEGVWLTKPVTWCHIHIQNGLWVEIGFGIWIIGSFLIYLFSVVLFIKPLLNVVGLISVKTQNELKKAKEHRVNHLIIKITTLNGIAIVSSFASLLVYLFTHITIIVDVDILITAACVLIATSRHHDSLYQKICKPCHVMGEKQRHKTMDKAHEKTKEGSNGSGQQSQNSGNKGRTLTYSNDESGSGGARTRLDSEYETHDRTGTPRSSNKPMINSNYSNTTTGASNYRTKASNNSNNHRISNLGDISDVGNDPQTQMSIVLSASNGDSNNNNNSNEVENTGTLTLTYENSNSKVQFVNYNSNSVKKFKETEQMVGSLEIVTDVETGNNGNNSGNKDTTPDKIVIVE